MEHPSKVFSIENLTELELEEWLYYEETLFPADERADGQCICEGCGCIYYSHPYTGHKDWQGNHFLRLLCDGSVVKL